MEKLLQLQLSSNMTPIKDSKILSFEKQSLLDNNIHICKKGDNVTNIDHLTRFQKNLQKKRPVHPDVGVSLSLQVLLSTKPHSSSRANSLRS